MHPYIPHLLSDIEAAHRTEQLAERTETLEQMLDKVSQRRNGHSFGYHCGLEAINFPPEEQLLVKDVKLVNSAFKKMLKSWNVSCHLPRRVPPKMVYRLLIQTLQRKFDPSMQGNVLWGYCSLNTSNCVLKEYCSCLAAKSTGTSSDGFFIHIGSLND
jgi:hypothetical protein